MIRVPFAKPLALVPILVRLGAAVALSAAGCDGSSQRGAAAGEPCEMRDTTLVCGPSASICYAAGRDSSCAGGGLCVGDGSGMTCAYRCKQDSDCGGTSVTAVCMQGCKASILNGYCVEPAVRSDLLSMTCSTGSAATTGTTGVGALRGPARSAPLWDDDTAVGRARHAGLPVE